MVVGLTAAPGLASAQSSGQRDIRVPFGPPVGGDGYTGGSVGVSYAFLACFGEIHINYTLAAGSAQTSDVYLMGGKTYVADGTPPKVDTIRFAGTVYRGGSEFVGNFADGAIGAYSAKGCFSGITQKVGMLTPWLGERPTPEKITNFLNTLTLKVEPAGPVRDTSLESRLKAQDRARQAAVDNQQRQEKAAAEARRVAEERRKAEAAKPVSRTPTGAGGGYAPQQATPSPQPTPRPLTDAERGDRAIASDKILAEQRLAEQRRFYAQQQASVEAERQRQIQMQAAMVQAAPVIYGALESVTNSIDQAFAQAKANRWSAAQSNLVGKCRDGAEGNWPIAKDGDLVLGVPMRSELTTADCGDRPDNRFKTFRLMIDEQTRVRIKADGSIWMNATIVLIGTKPQKTVITRYDAPATGVITASSAIIANLPPGEYHVMIHNASGAGFRPFTVLVNKVDAKNRVIPSAPPPAPNQVEALPPPGPAPAPTLTRTAAGLGGILASVGGSLENQPPTWTTPRQSAAQIAAQPLQTIIVTDRHKADIAARKSQFAIGWTPSRVVEINSRGNSPAGSLNTKCNKLVSATPEPTLLTYKTGDGGQSPGGIVRYAGEGSRCRPQTAGVIQYADGTQWIGGVTSLDATPFLPQPDGLGEFKFAEGVSKMLRARKSADGSAWEIAEEFVEPPSPPPLPEVAKPPVRKAAPKRKR